MDCLAVFARSWRGLALALVLASPLGACASFKNVAGPPPAFDVNKDIAEFTTHYSSATSIASYYQQPETKARRDEFVIGRLTLYNLQYIKYIQSFALDRAQAESVFDITNLTLGVANTLVGGEADHAAITAATSLLSGSRLAIEKNFYNERTVPALVTQMNASRQAALVPILRGLKQDPSAYPLSQALVDLQGYYEAGTIQGALLEVQQQAGVKKAAADRQIEQLRSVRFVEDASSRRIRAWLWPTRASDTPGGAPLDASGAPAVPDATRLAALRKWLADNGWQNVPVQQFINGDAMAEARQDAVAALAIPNVN